MKARYYIAYGPNLSVEHQRFGFNFCILEPALRECESGGRKE